MTDTTKEVESRVGMDDATQIVINYLKEELRDQRKHTEDQINRIFDCLKEHSDECPGRNPTKTPWWSILAVVLVATGMACGLLMYVISSEDSKTRDQLRLEFKNASAAEIIRHDETMSKP